MDKNSHVVLPGSKRAVFPGSKVANEANPDEIIELTLKLRRKAPLPQPTAPGQSLSRAELEEKYGASPEDISHVEKVLEAYGITVVDVNTASQTMHVSGAIKEIEDAFLVKLFHYQNSERGDYRGRTGSIHVPAELDGIILGVFGLDNRPVTKKVRRSDKPKSPLALAAVKKRSWFYSSELATHYNFPAADVTGKSIGLLEFGGGYFPADLASYCKSAGISTPPTVIPVSVDSAATNAKDGAEGEVMLDIEVVAGVCPQATIVVYFSTFSEKGWVDAVDTAIHDTKNNPQVISVSWGYAEDAPGVWSAAAISAINNTMQEAATLGITVCISSGDDGSDDQVGDGHAHVDFPSSSPYVLSVGGTKLTSKSKTFTEVAWKDGDGLRKDNGGASGGGVSVCFARPTWQSNINIKSVNPGAIVGRVMPDVAADASASTGYFVVVDGQANIYGGTSAATPLWASLILRINTLLEQQGKKAVGYLTPLLYQAGQGTTTLGTQTCYDITKGNNISAKIGGYKAEKGYDAVTGWGSPEGQKLLTALTSIL